MNPALIQDLVNTANHLAAIQIENVQDYAGFSNADKNLGAHLAALVSVDASDLESVAVLASLVGIKYQRQALALVGEATLGEFKKLAKGAKVTPAQRDAARLTVLLQADRHEKFGERALFAFQFNPAFAAALKNNGGKSFFGPDGWKWAVPLPKLADAIAELKLQGARIVGQVNFDDIEAHVKPARIVHCTLKKTWVSLSFAYDAAIIATVKNVPAHERRYDADSREWSVPAYHVGELIEAFKALPGEPVDVSEMEAVVPHLPQSARPIDASIAADAEIVVPDAHLAAMRDYQRTGVSFLTQPMYALRSNIEHGASVRGIILGDDMGLGKTMQSIVAAKAVAGAEGRILVVCPATLKINWKREIAKWLGPTETVNIIESAPCTACSHGSAMHADGKCVGKIETATGKTIVKTTRPKLNKKGEPMFDDKGVPMFDDIVFHYCGCMIVNDRTDAACTWNIVNYDIIGDNYNALEALGYDVLIVDEAHYTKNRTSIRSKTLVGGRITVAHYPTQRDPRDSKLVTISGLAASARKRVFLLTGTPLTNRTRDLFNLLRAIGHPLGRNFKTFAQRYCDPEINDFGTVYNGSSNVQELRAKINPVFLQRKAEDHLHELPGRQLDWLAVEVDLKAYLAVMKDYEARRIAGELSSAEDHLALLNEARVCAAVAKIDHSITLAENAIEQGHKVIIASQYTRVTDRLLAHFGTRAVAFVGDRSPKEKQAAVDAFQDDPSKTVFVGTYTNGQSAATGLTLTAASYVIVNDLDWVPANIKQLYKRADRMGQKRFVQVVFVIAVGTFDEEMQVMLESKLAVVNEFEEVTGSLFADLIARLATAPQNLEVREAYEKRMMGVAKRTAA